MRIFDFDTEERLSELEKSCHYVEIIKNRFSDCRSDFRDFAREKDIEFSALEACCKGFERNLLIDVYTYSEQLVKNLYYALLLNRDESNNVYIQNFINKKLPQKRFSPNVNYSTLEKSIHDDLIPHFKFTISEQRDQVKSYNELVESRHTYAHRGEFGFSNNYKEVIDVERFITKEVEMIVGYSVEYRIEYQRQTNKLCTEVNRIVGLVKHYKDSPHPKLKRKIRDNAKMLKILARAYYGRYEKFYRHIYLMNNTYRALDSLINQDLRKQSETFEKIMNLNDAILRECIRCAEEKKKKE